MAPIPKSIESLELRTLLAGYVCFDSDLLAELRAKMDALDYLLHSMRDQFCELTGCAQRDSEQLHAFVQDELVPSTPCSADSNAGLDTDSQEDLVNDWNFIEDNASFNFVPQVDNQEQDVITSEYSSSEQPQDESDDDVISPLADFRASNDQGYNDGVEGVVLETSVDDSDNQQADIDFNSSAEKLIRFSAVNGFEGRTPGFAATFNIPQATEDGQERMIDTSTSDAVSISDDQAVTSSDNTDAVVAHEQPQVQEDFAAECTTQPEQPVVYEQVVESTPEPIATPSLTPTQMRRQHWWD